MTRLSSTYYLLILAYLLAACKHEPYQVDHSSTGYPEHIAKIISGNCATTGCHNDKSYKGAGGLNLTTWENMFHGGFTGSVVIPYRPDFSTLCYYTNTDTLLGVTLEPTMPVNNTPLSKDDYLALVSWIKSGAGDNNGTIKFADNDERTKLYVTNKLCDVVTVFDMESLLQMRYVNVGQKAAEEFPHKVLVSPDKRHWYVSFFVTSNIIQKFSSVNDRLTGEINIGPGSWTSFDISADSKYGYFVSNRQEGKLAVADLETMQLVYTHTFDNKLKYPYGVAINNNLNKLYIGNTFGNYLYSIDISRPEAPTLQKVILDGGNIYKDNSSIDPAEMIIDEKTNKCYMACTHSKDIKVVDMQRDSVIASISLGSNPAFISLAPKDRKLFVTCPDDETSFPGERGAVVVIDLNTNTITKRIYSGYQPYGIVADEKRGIVAVVNANLNSEGDEPHHSSDCDGRNGYISFININTLEVIPGERSEVAVFPYSISAR